jgi:predicted XRE-type DNA-binding protein
VNESAYTGRAAAAILAAARSEHDFAGWLAQVLATVAGQLGSSDALTAGRPGSWEAADVDHLVKGTVGHGDEYLPGPARNRRLTDANARQIKDAADRGEMTQREIAAEFGVSASTVSDIATGRTWGWLK